MRTLIHIRPEQVGDVGHVLTGPDHDIPILTIGPVEVVFYDHNIDPGQMSAWLADLSSHALTLAAEIDARWPACSCGSPDTTALNPAEVVVHTPTGCRIAPAQTPDNFGVPADVIA